MDVSRRNLEELRLQRDVIEFRRSGHFGRTNRFDHDAEICFTQEATTETKENVGFVPLLHLRGNYPLSENVSVRFDFQGRAAPRGRAFDILLADEYAGNESLAAHAGDRMVDGGADSKTVYNCA